MTTSLSRTEVTPGPAAAPASPTAQSDRGLPRWVSHGTLALTLLAVLALYTYDLAASGYANSFYSAAVQAGSVSWKAFFYGALDAGSSITVDKTPASLWLMALSVRLFGLSSWSILLPQALLGVGSAAVLYASVRRALTGRFSATWPVTSARAHVAGLVAALTLALTPAATLMFRFNNPDALMVFAYVVAAYCTVRATEAASRKWLALAGVAIGVGFLAKMLQAFVLLPSLVLAYAVAAPASWRKKLVDLLVAFAAMVVSFGWYIAVVELVPASWRPYIGGSQTNSILELTFGYNGLGRLSGNETGSVGGMGGSGGQWGSTGILRMFTSQSGEMVSFLIPGALILAGVALVMIGRRAYANVLRHDRATGETLALGALVLYASWLVVNGLVFSFMAGIYHDYYTVALAPAIAGTVALGGTVLWSRRRSLVARIGLATAAVATAVWSVTLATVPGGIYLALALGGAIALVLGAGGVLLGRRLIPAFSRTALGLVVAGGLVTPAAYSIETALTPHTGSIVTAGPASRGLDSSSGRGGVGGPGGFGGQNGRGTFTPPQGTTGAQAGAAGTQQGGMPAMGGGLDGRNGGMGGLINGTSVSSEMVTLLGTDASSYTWVAATTGSQNSASYQLATGYAVMAIGGFNGSDPSPTLEQFTALVAAGKIHYYIAAGSFGGQSGGSSASAEISSWVSSSFTAQTVGGVTVYDLTQGK
ncbi:MAG TPA: glycosyltransferase family 39 protein [Propionibacteriaceae bacterium]|nr:glycosyltransferase family 39 protein [Propionibacteriaceae bacterium]